LFIVLDQQDRLVSAAGNPEAAASAYSLYDYVVADDLGGVPAYENLCERAGRRGIRLASDMVPNHMGIDSRWMIQHPDWFLSLPYSPYPAYSFNGPDVSQDERVEIKVEDHYFDRSDAAVVFRRADRWTGDQRYIYHGNDGTSFPWNDTAQLNYLNPEVREAVIQTILHVARQFPIIRFDAAMTLTKQHFQRLWFPAPGGGGAIPSRAEHGISKAEFDAAMPNEFWREVVDRVAAEVPGTLLLAEAFWLLEGYFVRTLGMHRVYNSAFMNMLRDEENANYRSVLKNTLEFDPEVLKRYVNFMNNPDERTAVDQFGKGDKYFGVCTMLATLPGLPMFGHGQIEGFGERYGMEYRRAYHEETPDAWLVARHEREISPLLHRRALFSEAREFLLYDFFTDDGNVNEDVFAYSNRRGEQRALVVYNNRYAETRGWIRNSCAYAEKAADGSKRRRRRTLGEGLGLSGDPAMFVAYRDALDGLEYLHRARSLAEQGLRLELSAFKCRVFLDWRDLRDDGARPWGALCDQLGGRGVSSLDDALLALELKPVHDAFRELLNPEFAAEFARLAGQPVSSERDAEADRLLDRAGAAATRLLQRTREYLKLPEDRPATGGARPATDDRQPATGYRQPATEGWLPASFTERLRAALRLPGLEPYFASPWPEEARAVLPGATTLLSDILPGWSAVLSWCVLEALGSALSAVGSRLPAGELPVLRDGQEPRAESGEPGAENREPAGDNRQPTTDNRQPAAVTLELFDTLHLRALLAEAFAALGLEGEERWRAAARVRAVFADESLLSETGAAPFSWLHDPDIAWLVGLHEYEGVRYIVKEPFERLLWWMALPQLLSLAAAGEPDPVAVRLLEEQLHSRMAAAAATGYQVEALFAK
jgi:hypothetical protein